MKQVALFASLLTVIACTHVDPNDNGRAIYGSVAATESGEANRISGGPETRQPSMKEVWQRLWWNIRHLGSEQINPYVLAGEGDSLPKERSALEDLPHALKNVPVEGWRKLIN